MTETKKEQNNTRPGLSRVFLSKPVNIELPDTKAHFFFWLVVFVGVAFDLWSKSAVFNWLQDCPSGSVTLVDGFLKLVMAVNDGAAFGIASGKRWLLVAVSLAALVIIFSVFLFGKTRQTLVNVALALLAAGVCGNLYDRMFNNGFVRDFIDVVYWPGRHWPAFNVADSILCIGVGLLIISSLRTSGHTS